MEVYRFEPGHEPKPVLTSSVGDYDPDYSPDGSHIAFASVRSGEAVEIWLAKVDGSDPHQLTHGPGRWQGSPRWSPDGRRIAFDSVDDSGHSHVWTIDADGGVPRRLTSDPGHQNRPTWSGDGTYVYYSETTGNQQDIWRIPSAGGVAQQVTRTGSVQAYEVTSGRFLVYQNGDGKKPLLLLPLGGGIAKQIVACVERAGFAARRDAVYYVGCEDSASPSIHRVDPLTGRDTRLGTLPDYFDGFRISVAPDGASILYPRNSVPVGAELMLIENFR